jgi:hypothetical protein
MLLKLPVFLLEIHFVSGETIEQTITVGTALKELLKVR